MISQYYIKAVIGTNFKSSISVEWSWYGHSIKYRMFKNVTVHSSCTLECHRRTKHGGATEFFLSAALACLVS